MARSHNKNSKIYSDLLKRVESKKCTPSIRRHYEAVPKLHIGASIWIFGIVMTLKTVAICTCTVFCQIENIPEY